MISKKLVCTQCGYVGDAKTKNKGSGLIELILWLCMILPGVIYSVWRRSSLENFCPMCKGKTLIPIDAPKARKVMEETMSKEEIENNIQKDKNEVLKEQKKENNIKIAVIVTVVIFVILIIIVS